MSPSTAASKAPLPPTIAATEAPRGFAPVARLGRVIPIVLAVAVLGGLAAWGHSTDWTLPKFSELVGGEATEADPWCKEHNVLESQCIECNKTLVPGIKDYGWCKEHGVAQCPLEHPDVAQLKTPAAITDEDRARASRALALLPRAENNSRCLLHQRRIQFASAEAVDKAGIDIAVVDQQSMVEAVTANGQVIYDQTHSAHLASRVAGTVWRVERQVGDLVRRGDVLALVDAAEIGKAKSEFLQAITQFRLKQTNVNRLRPLATDGTVPGRQLTEADSQLQEAQIQLLSTQQTLINLGLPVRAEEFAELSTDRIAERIQFLGLSPEMAANLSAETATSNLFPLRSPLDGVVVDCKVVPGEVVDTSTTIFGVADISRMWLMLDVRQEDAKYLVLGQPVLFRSGDSKSDPEIKGSLAWISTSADEQTRTVKVRVNLPNADGRLCANTFGAGRILLREEPSAVVVPSEAIHWDCCCNVVFVRDKNYLQDGAPKFFHIRTVRLGVKNGDNTEIIAGLLPGEVIASKNSVVLEAQLLKSNLGAGCGCGKD
jgi:cobalt-zinc-cadmium efflux system membrane fusion protein